MEANSIIEQTTIAKETPMWFRSAIDSLENRSSRPPLRKSSSQQTARSRFAARRINFEPLEDRRLLAFNVLAEYATGPYPFDLELAQIDAGSQPDLVVVNSGNNSISVRLGNADGTFGSPLTSGIVSNPRSLAAGDLTGDGATDLVTANLADISLLIGNGNGTFQPAQSISLPGQFPPGYTGSTALPQVPISVAVGDLDGDGNLDLAVTGVTSRIIGYTYGYYGQYPIYTSDGFVNVLLGNGTGGFDAPDAYHLGADRSPSAVAVADLNDDGEGDVITANSLDLSVLLGDGTGALGSPIHSGSGSALNSISLGDIDGDGNLDTVLRSLNASGLTVQKGDGAGHFAASSDVNVGSYVQSAVMGDVDADGKLDLVATATPFTVTGYYGYYGGAYGYYTKQAVVIIGDGQGNFALPQTSVLGTTANVAWLIDVGLADFTGDGLPELATLDFYAGTVIIASVNEAPPAPPSMAITDATVTEGHTGTVAATFTVTLSAAAAGPVTVAYATADSSAAANGDYQATSGSLTFAPGETSKTINVLVKGDRLAELNETFLVNLSGATGATIADGQGVGTIIDDDPSISISDVTKNEGNSGTTKFVFTVSLSAASSVPVTVNYATANGSAKKNDNDYVAKSGKLTFRPGETTKTITISVKGDKKKEAHESFFVNLTNANGALLDDYQGEGTILNDDKVHRAFNWFALDWDDIDDAIDDFVGFGRRRRGR
jgi:hypothetical protein